MELTTFETPHFRMYFTEPDRDWYYPEFEAEAVRSYKRKFLKQEEK